MTDRETKLRRRTRALTWLFLIGLIISGLTAIPLEWELTLILNGLGVSTPPDSGLTAWLWKVREALQHTDARYPFLAYGYDWLAFAHIIIAIAFIGALRDPVQNRWLYDFGLIACGLVIPWAILFGEVRQIPWGWRLIDCSFGVVGAIPLWFCRRWVAELARGFATRTASP